MVNKAFLSRLVMDGAAACLLVAGLAYWWLGNVAHEWIGVAMLVLVLAHNLFNRRWWGAVALPVRTLRSGFDRAWTALLLAGMAALALTSVLVSQSVFAFLQLDAAFRVRQIHALAAYWVIVLVAVHLGVRWKRVMVAVRGALKLSGESRARTAALRFIAALIAAYGLKSSFVMGVGGKLAMQMQLDGWDFESSAAAFFIHWTSIIGLYASASHYGMGWLANTQRKQSACNT